MLSNKMTEALNEQIALEGNSSAAYLSIASWCETQGLSGCASFFYDQSSEERMHMMKIIHYINEMDGHAIIPAQEKPRDNYGTIQEVFDIVYQQEKKVTNAIYNLIAISNEDKDHSTNLFLQWYVAEQREEEAMVRTILDTIKLIGNGPQSLYYIDKEVEKINQQKEAEEAGAELNA